MKLRFTSPAKQWNVVDSCGWIAYFKGEANAAFFDSPLNDVKHLIVPALSIFEVCKNVFNARGDAAAHIALATMQKGRVVQLEPDGLYDPKNLPRPSFRPLVCP